MENSRDAIAYILTRNNVRPTLQRITILEYLTKNQSHPTIDQVYRDLIKVLPNLSKTTIYNTLNVFLEHNVVHSLTIEENEVRIDSTTDSHGHFKCRQCGRVYNFSINVDQHQAEELSQFQIDERQVYFKGICAECLDMDNG